MVLKGLKLIYFSLIGGSIALNIAVTVNPSLQIKQLNKLAASSLISSLISAEIIALALMIKAGCKNCLLPVSNTTNTTVTPPLPPPYIEIEEDEYERLVSYFKVRSLNGLPGRK